MVKNRRAKQSHRAEAEGSGLTYAKQQHLTEKAGAPCIHLVVGSTASGKSTIAESIAHYQKAIIMDELPKYPVSRDYESYVVIMHTAHDATVELAFKMLEERATHGAYDVVAVYRTSRSESNVRSHEVLYSKEAVGRDGHPIHPPIQPLRS